MYDTHIHTNSSHDSDQTFDMICQSAIKKGLKAVSLTDHVDLLVYDDEKNRKTILDTAEYAQKAKQIYGDKLEVFTGIEFAMSTLDKKKEAEFINMIDADIVLGSVHSFDANGKIVRFSRDDLSECAISKEELCKYIELYYKALLNVSAKADIDVLCHLTYPIRYTNQKYNRGIDIYKFSDILTKILKTIIDRGIALEINTGKFEDDTDDLAPTPDIIQKYYELGGKLVTIGSDAHIPNRIGNGFDAVKTLLKNTGFDSYVYFKNRKPVFVKL